VERSEGAYRWEEVARMPFSSFLKLRQRQIRKAQRGDVGGYEHTLARSMALWSAN
jgi:hypothetical protein